MGRKKLAMGSCGPAIEGSASMAMVFGEAPDGTPVLAIDIANGGVCARVLTWGASLQDVRLAGVAHPLVLGSPTLAPYLSSMLYFGAIVGRVANRIAQGRALLDGVALTLERNEHGLNTLHGGSTGSASVNWTLDSATPQSCRLSVTLADGAGGFPGALRIGVTYALDTAGALSIAMEAQTDAPTFCALAHHSYWNLDGTGDLSNHLLWVNADRYLPVNDAQIPLGRADWVAGTPFDYRQLRRVDADVDHTFCLNTQDRPLRACTLEAAGLRLSVFTEEPGLQVFNGHTLNTGQDSGLTDRPYGPRAGVALEPQRWPDAPNQPGFPSIVLRPGQVYRQRSVFHIERLTGGGGLATSKSVGGARIRSRA